MSGAIPDHLEPGVIFDHGSRTPEELNAEIVDLAWRLGWRGRDSDDAALIRNVMVASNFPDPEQGAWVAADGSTLTPPPPRGFDPDDALAVAENLTWAADDATVWLNERFAPAGHWVGNDGEAGAFGAWADESDVRNWATAELREQKAAMVAYLEGDAENGPRELSDEDTAYLCEVNAELTRRADQAARS